MVDLDQVERVGCFQHPWGRQGNRLGGLGAQASACDESGVEGADAFAYAVASWRDQALGAALAFHFPVDFLHRRSRSDEVALLNGCLNDAFALRTEATTAFLRTSRMRDETRCLRGRRVSRN